jgi:hypothetical protein
VNAMDWRGGWGPTLVGIGIGPVTGTTRPTSTLPSTIPAHGYVSMWVRERFLGCMDGHGSASLGGVPISFRLLGVVSRRTTVYPPLTIRVSGPSCRS